MSNVAALRPEEWPALTEMGVTRFHEISHYVLSEESSRDDVLKIYYKRAKGSLLPYSRKYRFGRSLKTVVADSGTSTMESNYEISPYLQQAIIELDALIAQNRAETNEAPAPSTRSEHKQVLLEALATVEALSGKHVDGDDRAALHASLDKARQQVDAL